VMTMKFKIQQRKEVKTMSWINLEPVEFEFKEPGDNITGKLYGIRDGKFGPVYDFELPDNELRFIYGCTKLDRLLPKCLNQYVTVVFEGMKKTQQGNTFKDFQVKKWKTTDGSSPEGFEDQAVNI
jgi:hypothetical protein